MWYLLDAGDAPPAANYKLCTVRAETSLHHHNWWNPFVVFVRFCGSGIQPGPPPWQASALPLSHIPSTFKETHLEDSGEDRIQQDLPTLVSHFSQSTQSAGKCTCPSPLTLSATVSTLSRAPVYANSATLCRQKIQHQEWVRFLEWALEPANQCHLCQHLSVGTRQLQWQLGHTPTLEELRGLRTWRAFWETQGYQ